MIEIDNFSGNNGTYIEKRGISNIHEFEQERLKKSSLYDNKEDFNDGSLNELDRRMSNYLNTNPRNPNPIDFGRDQGRLRCGNRNPGTNQRTLETFSGIDSTYVNKREVPNMFDLSLSKRDQNGLYYDLSQVKDRFESNLSRTNNVSITGTREAPGLNIKDGSSPLPGYNDMYRYMPKNIDELRIDSKKRVINGNIIIPGKMTLSTGEHLSDIGSVSRDLKHKVIVNDFNDVIKGNNISSRQPMHGEITMSSIEESNRSNHNYHISPISITNNAGLSGIKQTYNVNKGESMYNLNNSQISNYNNTGLQLQKLYTVNKGETKINIINSPHLHNNGYDSLSQSGSINKNESMINIINSPHLHNNGYNSLSQSESTNKNGSMINIINSPHLRNNVRKLSQDQKNNGNIEDNIVRYNNSSININGNNRLDRDELNVHKNIKKNIAGTLTSINKYGMIESSHINNHINVKSILVPNVSKNRIINEIDKSELNANREKMSKVNGNIKTHDRNINIESNDHYKIDRPHISRNNQVNKTYITDSMDIDHRNDKNERMNNVAGIISGNKKEMKIDKSERDRNVEMMNNIISPVRIKSNEMMSKNEKFGNEGKVNVHNYQFNKGDNNNKLQSDEKMREYNRKDIGLTGLTMKNQKNNNIKKNEKIVNKNGIELKIDRVLGGKSNDPIIKFKTKNKINDKKSKGGYINPGGKIVSNMPLMNDTHSRLNDKKMKMNIEPIGTKSNVWSNRLTLYNTSSREKEVNRFNQINRMIDNTSRLKYINTKNE